MEGAFAFPIRPFTSRCEGETQFAKEKPAVHPNPTSRRAPEVLTVSGVMDLLRIGRTKAYAQARLILDTDWGLPEQG